jgi:hypothetical protein
MVTNMDSSSAQTLSKQERSDRNDDYAFGLALLWALLVIVASICVFVFDVGWMGTKSDQTILYVAGGIFALASVIGGAILAFISKNSAMLVLAVVFAILLSLNSAISVLWAGTALDPTSAAPAPAADSDSNSKSKSLPKRRSLPRGLDSYFEISKYIIYSVGGILVASPLLLLVLLQLVR